MTILSVSTTWRRHAVTIDTVEVMSSLNPTYKGFQNVRLESFIENRSYYFLPEYCMSTQKSRTF